MNHKYIVQLTDEERQELEALVQSGKTQGYRIKHAQILLKLDEIPENQEWTYGKIKEAYHAIPHTISQNAKQFVTDGLEAALGRKEQASRHKKIDGRVEVTHGLYTEMPFLLLSIGDFLPVMPDANSERFIPLSCNF